MRGWVDHPRHDHLAALAACRARPPKEVDEPHAFHKLSLIAFLAWVGLGADGLSSSAYGPEETFRQLGEHVGLAVFLAVAMIATVFIISYGYSRIIEQFPSGGGTEVAVEAEQLAVGLVQWYPKVVVVAGQIIFAEDTMWNRLLHNQTALVIQRRLQQAGVPMIVLPVELDLARV